MKDQDTILQNHLVNGSRYAANFDYLMHNYVVDKLSPYFKGGWCCELGAYKGAMTKKLLPFFNKFSVLEIEPELVAILNSDPALQNVEILHKDFTEYKKYTEFTDIISCHSLEHIESHIDFLHHLKSHKNKDTRVFFVVPNAHALSRRIAVKMGIIDDCKEVTAFEKSIGHFHSFTRETLKKDLISTGWSIIASGGIMLKPLSNHQFDEALASGIINMQYLDALEALSSDYADLSASIFFVCE